MLQASKNEKSLKILVVNDEPMQLVIVEQLLKNNIKDSSLEIETASDG